MALPGAAFICSLLGILTLRSGASGLTVWGEAQHGGYPGRTQRFHGVGPFSVGLILSTLLRPSPTICPSLLWVPLSHSWEKPVRLFLLSPRDFSCEGEARAISLLSACKWHIPATLRGNEHGLDADKHLEVSHPLLRSKEPTGSHEQPGTGAGRALEVI